MQQPIPQTSNANLDAPAATAEPGEIRRLLTACFMRTAAEQDCELRPLSDDLALLESGLDSLCFAIIVAEMEDQLGLDPFSDLDEAAFPVTFGEFVGLYEAAAQRGG